jgi:hypothetical protein
MLAIGVKPERGAVVIPGNKLAGWKLDTLIASDA